MVTFAQAAAAANTDGQLAVALPSARQVAAGLERDRLDGLVNDGQVQERVPGLVRSGVIEPVPHVAERDRDTDRLGRDRLDPGDGEGDKAQHKTQDGPADVPALLLSHDKRGEEQDHHGDPQNDCDDKH
jgi:hypothetical protein